jgi:glycosyltransferase involved in cell wall biosynthesis
MKLTLAITVFNRYDLLLESLSQVIDDPRIDEILICDDHSKDEYWNKIKELPLLSPKIKVVRQLENRGMQENKSHAIGFSKHDWVIILDSDNKIDKSYLDAIPNELFADTIYMPDFAKPQFSFKKYSGLIFNKSNIKNFINDPPLSVLLNCCNYLVNKNEYLSVYKKDPSIDGADTVNMAKNWLAAGKNFFVVPDMEYDHRVHKESQFLKDVNKNMDDAERIKKEIRQL